MLNVSPQPTAKSKKRINSNRRRQSCPSTFVQSAINNAAATTPNIAPKLATPCPIIPVATEA
jgi:hypothetical protein